MDHHELDKLIDKYLNGQCSASEKKHLEGWLAMQHQANLWNWPSATEQEYARKYIKDQIQQSISRKKQNRKKISWYFSRIAACILFLLTISIICYQIPGLRQYLSSIHYVKITAPIGQEKHIILPDSSTVILNVGSSIQYARGFSAEIRKVELLNGEAWFDIKNDKKRPFIVVSNAIETKVLGTSFNIKSYDFLPEISITVASGKVQVIDVQVNESHVGNVVFPNQQLKIDRQSRQQQISTIDINQISAWRQGRLHFDKDPLDLVAHMLKQKFGVTVKVDDINASEMFLTADFRASDSLESILRAISATFGLSYQNTSGTVVFKKE